MAPALAALHASALIRDTAGRVRRRQGTLVDITERRQMETRLQREQEFARRLVESFPDLVIALDREGRYTFVSPRSTELLGFSPDELIGTSVRRAHRAAQSQGSPGILAIALFPDNAPMAAPNFSSPQRR